MRVPGPIDHSRRSQKRAPRRSFLALVVGLVVLGFAPVQGQEIRGRVLETSAETPVALAGVFLLDTDREIAASVLADSLGRYLVRVPAPGEYYLLVQRLGYFETESPLIAVSADGSYRLDIEVRPEPIRLDPLLVTVDNEAMENWFTQSLGLHPQSILGFRAVQGAPLEEARLNAKDNTDLLRLLHIPVTHGINVCLGSRMPEVERGTGVISEAPCGKLILNGFEVPAEHLETMDKSEIALVVVLPPNVMIFKHGFDYSRPGPPG